MHNKILLNTCISLVLCSALTAADAPKGSLENFLQNISHEGQLRLGYVSYDPKGAPTTSATAIGGHVRFNVPLTGGVSVEAAPYIGIGLTELSGDKDENKYENSLTSSDENYALLGEANFLWEYDAFKVRVGRQIIETPLMGDDDLRMSPQSFEGVMAEYAQETWGLHAGYVTRWQGIDAGLEDVEGKGFYEFQKIAQNATTGEVSDGTLLLGANMTMAIGEGELATRGWYYGIDKVASVIYADTMYSGSINEALAYDVGLQYSHQSEKDDSGVEASLYGVMFGLGYEELYFYSAYVKSMVDTGKSLFYGRGGEFYYTASNEWAMGYQNGGEDETSWQLGLIYEYLPGMSVSGFYSEYKENASAHMSEMDIFVSFEVSDSWDAELVYSDITDKADSDNSYKNILFRANYNF